MTGATYKKTLHNFKKKSKSTPVKSPGVYTVVRSRGSHIFQIFSSQIAVSLSALRAGRQEDFWYSFLVEAESTQGP
jgi:hypothetical protein